MAGSEQAKQVDDSFDDDLDKMLQDTADQVGDDQEVLDSDDAINRLLGDSHDDQVLDDDFSENVDDLVDFLLEGVVAEPAQKVELSDEEIDEFADDSVELEVADSKIAASSDAASEPSSVLTEDEMSAFADDLLAEQEGIDAAIQDKSKTDADFTEGMTEIDEFSVDEEDFLLADFDISADDDDFKEEELPAAEQEESVAMDSEVPSEDIVPPPDPGLSASAVKSSDQIEKKAQIINESADLNSEADFSKVLDKAVKELKRANRELDEANKKLKVWSISALVVAVIALIIAITVVILNLGVQSNLDRVQGGVMDIEDRLAVPTIKLVDPNDAKIADLQVSVQSIQALVNDMPERLNALQGQINSINTEEIERVLEQRLVDINEKLVTLEAEVASSKSSKAKREMSPRKVVKRVVAQEWVVNLVSFKQRWYTDKKVQEYKQKGIPAEVVSVDVQGVEWFRVRVVGFKDKAEAEVYALKMKKSLNLNSVWVSEKQAD
ncbi:MAG: SPOR domain-containing protein [Methyloprofundus sp.]|nr:SPOR domain-containing protein [Methyloprofundus sp.]MBW6453161.1 SPOR domain-containing protein [Methyloprofundus sp.]